MIRNIDDLFAAHRQRFMGSEMTSLVELLLKLTGENPPDLQAREEQGPIGRLALVDQVYGRIALRSFVWGQEPFVPFLTEEIAAGRPVGLWLSNELTASGGEGERGWVAVRTNTVGDYCFADLYGKRPEQGEGDGLFTEKRVLQMGQVTPPHLSTILYCEELWPLAVRRVKKAGP